MRNATHKKLASPKKDIELKSYSLSGLGELVNDVIYAYRFDIFAMIIMIAFTMYYVEVLFRPGQVVFSDIDFPFKSSTYLDEVFGIWNTKWNTTSMLNIPRLLVLLPSFLLSLLAKGNGNLFLKAFIAQNLVTSGISFYLFCKRLVSVNISTEFNMSRIFVIIFGSLYYALNPWVIFRIQHIYLLVGYSLFPLILLLFFKIFDHKFQDAAMTDYDCFSSKLYSSNIRDIIFLAFTITVASAAIHYFFYTIFMLAPLLALLMFKYLIKYRKEDKKRRQAMWLNFFKKIVLLGIVFMGFSFYWLFIYVASIVFDVQASQNNINVVDTYVAFSRHSSLKDVLYFISYWWPMIDMRQLPLSFYIGGGMILVTSAMGLFVHAFKQHIILFMGLLSGFLIVFSTGVRYPLFAKVFLRVTDLPVIGSIFRDPNKLVALLALFLAVFFVFGLQFLLHQIDKLSAYRYVFIYSVVMLAAIGVLTYLLPMKNLYFEHFYAPIEQPESYVSLEDYYDNNKDHYGVYLPLSDEMIQPYSLVSTPYWNVNNRSSQPITKATGDVQVYNSPISTLFQFEGNDPAIAYYYNYIQYLMDQGRTNNMSSSLEAFGIDQMIYHDEYKQQYYRQDFNLDVIKLDDNLRSVFKNDIFHVFDLAYSLEERNDKYTMVNQVIETPYGFERTAIYEKMGLYKPLEKPVVYMNQKKSDVEDLSDITLDQNIVEVKNEKDLIFAKLPERYFLYPFQWTNQGNVFLGWSKTFLSSVDWSWYLGSQDMEDRAFEFDKGEGLAVTFASNRLAVEPYLRDEIKGKLILDFDTMLRTENLFVPDNPDMFEINSNPYSEIQEFQTLHGELVKGDPKDIWQVAKSGILEANEGTPYYFELLLSGRDVDRLHLKVRFYDEENEEIGVSYIVASTEESYFDTIKFVGEVISPLNTTHMRIDLLSYQNLNYKSYWWIHDINIYDLSQYVEENIIEGDYEALSSDVYDVYIKTFDSDKGGLLEVRVEDESFELVTVDEHKNTLGWHYLGDVELDEGKHLVQLVGKDGFNGVNAIVLIPKSDYELFKNQLTKELEDAGIIMTFETSVDLDYMGNIQSKRLYPTLSLGKGIALEEGIIKGEFDILKSEEYTFYPNMHYVDKNKGYGKLKLYQEEKLLQAWELTKREHIEKLEPIVDYQTNSNTYPYSFLELMTPYNYQDTQGYSLYLEAGHYKFEVELQSETDQKSSLEQIKPFDTSIIKFPPEDTQSSVVGSCERISWDMMNEEIINGNLLITLDPTCSTDWYSYATNEIKVSLNEEYLIRFDARSTFLKKRHSKVLFLDENNNYVDVVYINEVEEQYKEFWNHYEQLVTVPEQATQMIIQFLGNGDREDYATLEIKDFDVFNYNEFILLDHLFIENEKAGLDRLNMIESEAYQVERQLNQFGLNYLFDTTNEGEPIFNTFLSPNKNWRYEGRISDYLLNGITQGFIINDLNSNDIKSKDIKSKDTKEYSFGLLLMPGYIVGIGIHVFTMLVCLIWFVYITTKSKK